MESNIRWNTKIKVFYLFAVDAVLHTQQVEEIETQKQCKGEIKWERERCIADRQADIDRME